VSARKAAKTIMEVMHFSGKKATSGTPLEGEVMRELKPTVDTPAMKSTK
jgi:hypothetical protein